MGAETVEGHESESEEIRELRAELIQIVLEDLRRNPNQPTLVKLDQTTIAALLGDWQARLDEWTSELGPLKDSLGRLEVAVEELGKTAVEPAPVLAGHDFTAEFESLRREISSLAAMIGAPKEDEQVKEKASEPETGRLVATEGARAQAILNNQPSSGEEKPDTLPPGGEPHHSVSTDAASTGGLAKRFKVGFQRLNKRVGARHVVVLVLAAVAILIAARWWRGGDAPAANESSYVFEGDPKVGRNEGISTTPAVNNTTEANQTGAAAAANALSPTHNGSAGR